MMEQTVIRINCKIGPNSKLHSVRFSLKNVGYIATKNISKNKLYIITILESIINIHFYGALSNPSPN
jgi:hypothetical protein